MSIQSLTLNPGAGGSTLPGYVDAAGNVWVVGATGWLVADGDPATLDAVSMAAPLPVQPGTGAVFAVSQSGSWSVALAAGAATVGAVNLAQYPPVSGRLPVDGSGVTQPISAAALPLPAGAATAAKQPAIGTAGAASSDVLTVQGIASMTALKVDGSAVTQPVSGTVTANAGTGTFAVSAAALPLPTGAATAANQTTGNSSLSSIDGKTPALGQALAAGSVPVVLTAAQLTTLTPLATVAVTQSGTWSTRTQDGVGNALTSATRGAQQALSVQIVDASGNQITSFGGSGGTSSNFGSAFPAAGTAVGAKDSAGTNMAPLNLDASGNLKVNVAAGGGSGGTSSNFSAAFPGTGTAAGASNGTNMVPLLVDGSGFLKVNVAAGGGSGGTSSSFSATFPATGTAAGAYDGTNMVPFLVDGSGFLKVNVAAGTVAVTQSGTWNVTNISGTVSLPTGAATAAKQPALGTAGSASADVITVQGVASMTPVAVSQSGTWALSTVTTVTTVSTVTSLSQWAGNAIDTNSGNKSAGTLRVVLATDQPQLTNALKVDGSGVTQPVSGTVTANAGTGTFTVSGAVTQSGTWTIQPGNTANTTPWLVSDQAATAGGTSLPYSFLSTAAVQAAQIKGSAGQVYALHFFNVSATPVFVRLYNMTGTPATTDTPVYRATIPGNTAGAGFVAPIPPGVAFGTGIGIRVTGAVADNDNTALSANTIMGNVFYK